MRYGFVTFAQAQQCYNALESAPNDPDIQHYDVFFGGRRAFCKQYYADLGILTNRNFYIMIFFTSYIYSIF